MTDNAEALPPLPKEFGRVLAHTAAYSTGGYCAEVQVEHMSHLHGRVFTDAQMKDYARAALAQRQQAPERWQLVPVEPTDAMVYAGKEQANKNAGGCRVARKTYGAMLAAAPALTAAPIAQAETVRQLHSFSSIDCEKLIAATVPGGSACDPQEVADSIRRYLNAWPSAQAEPRACAYNNGTCTRRGCRFECQASKLAEASRAAQAEPQVPLSDGEIKMLMANVWRGDYDTLSDYGVAIVRAYEKARGIGKQEGT